MFACVIRNPDGEVQFYLAQEDENGHPILPSDWTVLELMHWKRPLDDRDDARRGALAAR